MLDRNLALRGGCAALLIAATVFLPTLEATRALAAADEPAAPAQPAAAEKPAVAELQVIAPNTFKAAPPKAADSPAAPEVRTGGADAEQAPTDGAVLGFQQEQVVAQMAELEERMYRLAETLRELEPENSSRLRLGLKYAREELIRQEMVDLKRALEQLELQVASTAQAQVLDKLQRLQDLLLSTDLDFQLRLERLRQLREILKRLDGAIKEEDRERKESSDLAKAQEEIDRLRKKQASLEELIRRQKEHIAGSQKANAAAADAAPLGKLAEEQEATRVATRALQAVEAEKPSEGAEPAPNADTDAGTDAGTDANTTPAAAAASEPSPAPPREHLAQAEQAMQQAHQQLAEDSAEQALPHQERALQELEAQQQKLAEELAQREAKLAQARFETMVRDQAGNRQLTDDISEMVRGLGQSGSRAMTELINASGKMSGAEQSLAQRLAEGAAGDQQQALDSLELARSELEEEAERLLEELRPEVKRKIMEGLATMLERQIAVRETTQTLASVLGSGSRQALSSVVALADKEREIVDMATDLLTLVEETEFAIALPAALRVTRNTMGQVQLALADGDASPAVVKLELEVEEDLQALLEAMKFMPSQSSNGRAERNNAEGRRRRELNRILSELKMVRLLQTRVNGDTRGVDGRRGEGELSRLSEELKDAIGQVELDQDDIREATQQIIEDRAEELDQLQVQP